MKPLTFFSSQAGAVLKTMRQARNLSQAQAAQLLDITAPALSKFEKGNVKTLATFETYARKYNFRVDFLVTDLIEEKKEVVRKSTSNAKRAQMDINGALNELKTDDTTPAPSELPQPTDNNTNKAA